MQKRSSPTVVISYVSITCTYYSERFLILFDSCAIQSMCSPYQEYQLINPTTQVALFSTCFSECQPEPQISWTIYQGWRNGSLNITEWRPVNISSILSIFGKVTFDAVDPFKCDDSRFEYKSSDSLEDIVWGLSPRPILAFCSDLFLRFWNQHKCSGLLRQPSSKKRFVHNQSYDGYSHHSLVFLLVGRGWHSRLLTLR